MRTLLIATVASLALAPAAAHAAYFVTAVTNVGTDSDGGFVQNGPTSKSASVAGGAGQAHVDLATGQAKTYVAFYGPDAPGADLGSASAVFGDTVTFSGATDATFSFNVDGSIYSDPLDPENTSTFQILVLATLRVFESGAGATSSNFTSHPGALVSDTFLLELRNPTDGVFQTVDELLFGSTSVLSGGSYDVFASISTSVAMNGHPAFVELDFLNTATFGIEVGPGVTYSSDSGVLVGSVTAAVPEPQAWALMLAGFFGAGAMIRDRRRAFA